MKLNCFEFYLMNNPARRILKRWEVRRVRALSSLLADKIILEIGCGDGTGAQYIHKYFRPRAIRAIDIDERMVALAKERSNNKSIVFERADSCRLPYESNSFDAVFEFGVLHHIPAWKTAIEEIYRVLRDGGEFASWTFKLLKIF